MQREKCLVIRHPCMCFYVHRPATRLTRRCGEQGSNTGAPVVEAGACAAWRSGRATLERGRSPPERRQWSHALHDHRAGTHTTASRRYAYPVRIRRHRAGTHTTEAWVWAHKRWRATPLDGQNSTGLRGACEGMVRAAGAGRRRRGGAGAKTEEGRRVWVGA